MFSSGVSAMLFASQLLNTLIFIELLQQWMLWIKFCRSNWSGEESWNMRKIYSRSVEWNFGFWINADLKSLKAKNIPFGISPAYIELQQILAHEQVFDTAKSLAWMIFVSPWGISPRIFDKSNLSCKYNAYK